MKKKEEKKEKTLNELIIDEAVKQYKEGNIGWIVNPFLNNFYKDTFLYSIGVK